MDNSMDKLIRKNEEKNQQVLNDPTLEVDHLNREKWEKLVGQKFGKLTLIEYIGRIECPTQKQNYRNYFWAQCDCGSPKKIVNYHGCKSGTSTSCGCVRLRKQREAVLLHGKSNDPWWGWVIRFRSSVDFDVVDEWQDSDGVVNMIEFFKNANFDYKKYRVRKREKYFPYGPTNIKFVSIHAPRKGSRLDRINKIRHKINNYTSSGLLYVPSIDELHKNREDG